MPFCKKLLGMPGNEVALKVVFSLGLVTANGAEEHGVTPTLHGLVPHQGVLAVV